MFSKQNGQIFASIFILSIFIWGGIVHAQSDSPKTNIYDMGILKPIDSVSSLRVGDKAPDFSLPTIGGLRIPLSQYLEKKNVVISFVPAAWTSVCSAQWPEYAKSKDLFVKNNAILLGISVDNLPTLHAWTQTMCMGKEESLWFPVFSDFHPHGAVAKKYGVLRSDGVTERALFIIDKKGIIRYIDIHDINKLPPLEELVKALEDLQGP